MRLTKAERELLDALLDLDVRDLTDDVRERARFDKARLSLVAKLEAAEKPRGTGVAVAAAVEAFREVLGNRLIAPLSSARGVWAQMQNRLNALGLSRMDCISAAKVAGVEWRGAIKAESIVRQADRLLQAAQLELPTNREGISVEMDDL